MPSEARSTQNGEIPMTCNTLASRPRWRRTAALCLLGALAAPWAHAQELAPSLTWMGIKADVATSSYWAFGGGLGAIGVTVPDYMLAPLARVGSVMTQITPEWKDKLDVTFAPPPLPTLATGVHDDDENIVYGPLPSGWYAARSKSAIDTAPQFKWTSPPGVPVPPVFPVLKGVSSKLSGEVEIRPLDANPEDLGPGEVEARAEVYDPFHFHDVAPGEVLSLDIRMNTGDRFFVAGDKMRMNTTLTGRSTMPGLESLFTFSLGGAGTGLGGGQATTFFVDFTANPLLGIDTAAVQQAVLDAIVWDDTEGAYLVTSDVPLFVGDIAVPDGTTAFELAIDYSSSLTAVPEPGTWAQLLAGAALLGRLQRRRSRRA